MGATYFFTAEALIGKKPDPRIVNTFMTLGFLLLIALMLFSILNDFLCPDFFIRAFDIRFITR